MPTPTSAAMLISGPPWERTCKSGAELARENSGTVPLQKNSKRKEKKKMEKKKERKRSLVVLNGGHVSVWDMMKRCFANDHARITLIDTATATKLIHIENKHTKASQ